MNLDHPPLPLNAGTGAGVWAVALGRDGGYEFGDAGAGMLVFWWQGRPVGHRFVEHDTPRPLHGHVDAELLARIDAEERAAAAPREPASVVICTRDRPEALARCLASLREQTLAPREVIVVDNASRDARTSEIAAAAGAVVVREERPGLDFARNAGARRATMPIVAYTDDDVQLDGAWLERMVAAFDRDDIAAVTGLVLPGELATEAQHHFETHWSFGRGYLRRDHDAQQFQARRDEVFPAWEIGAGASMAFRREVFERIGGFDERLDVGRAGCSGDSEYWYRLLAHGLTCRYEPRAVAFHFHRRSADALARQIHDYMRGHAAALLVQHERTGIAANRRQAWVRMPHWYARRVWSRWRGAQRPEDRFLREEVLGYLSGLWFYLRHRREQA
jgi:GT2 family glycosyltransferase